MLTQEGYHAQLDGTSGQWQQWEALNSIGKLNARRLRPSVICGWLVKSLLIGPKAIAPAQLLAGNRPQ